MRERVSEFERQRLTYRYHFLVTGDLNQALETLLLQKRMFPHIFTASSDLAMTYSAMGQSDQAATEAVESIGLNPN